MNTLFLDMIIPPVATAMVIAVCYLVSKIVLRITLKKTLEHYAMLYDMMHERDDELRRYHRMFGPLKDWEDSECLQNSLFGEEDNVKGEYLTPQQIEERYNGVERDENDELPF